MARARVRLDHSGVAEVLSSPFTAAAVRVEAEKVAAVARAHHSVVRHNVDVQVDVYQSHGKSSRKAASVTLKHPAGLRIDAKYGVLSQFAKPYKGRRRGG